MMDAFNHPWKRCRYGGCEYCCNCGEACECQDNFTTAADLIEALSHLEPNARIVVEEDGQFYDLAFFSLCALKPYTTEFVYREYDEQKGGYGAPEGAEECYVISSKR